MVERADPLDEHLLEGGICHFEAKDVPAVGDGRPQDVLGIAIAVDVELGVILARPGHRDVRQDCSHSPRPSPRARAGRSAGPSSASPRRSGPR